MAWFGDHLTSLTGKISEFTKDVLNDTSSYEPSEARSTSSVDNIANDDIIQLCKEKDLRISKLIAEKEEIENNIVQLNEQHEEAVDHLLRMKLELEKDNRELKSQLKEKEKLKTMLPDFSLFNSVKSLNFCDNAAVDENIDSFISNLNVLTILAYFRDCCSDNAFLDFVSKLEEVEHFIGKNNKLCYEKIMPKLVNYINYFKVLCDHRKEMLPFMDELTSVLEDLHSKYILSSQTELKDGHCRNNESFKNEVLSPNKLDKSVSSCSIQTNAVTPDASKYIQTDIDLHCMSNNLQSLRDSLLEISSLKEQIQSAEEKMTLKSFSQQNTSQQTDLLVQNDSDVQTDLLIQNDSDVQTDLLVQNDSDVQTDLQNIFTPDSSLEMSSTHVQTDIDYQCMSNNLQSLHDSLLEISSLKQQIRMMEEKALSKMNSQQNTSQQTDLLFQMDSDVQTDCTSEMNSSDLLFEISSTPVQTDIDLQRMSNNLQSLDDSLTEISYLKEEIQSLKEDAESKLTSRENISQQTDFLSQNDSSMQTDFPNISTTDSLFEVSSIHIQTDIDFQNMTDKLQLLHDSLCEISRLKKQIQTLEEETALKSDSRQTISQQTDCLLQNNWATQTDNDNFVSAECFNKLQLENNALLSNIQELQKEIEDVKSKPILHSVPVQTVNICRCAELKRTLTEGNEQIKELYELLSSNGSELDMERHLTFIDKLESDLRHINDNTINSQRANEMKLKDLMLSLKSIVREVCVKCAEVRNEQKDSSSNELQKKIVQVNGVSTLPELRNEQSQKTVYNDKVIQQQLNALNLEKNQLLCMLNEKSQENSTLKGEVHRLTNIVASEKQALLKLQRDNNDLTKVKGNNLDSDFTKESFQKMCLLIRDKDIEIEALKQKSESLSSILQNPSLSPEIIQNLMEERETLTKQIKTFEVQQEKIKKKYNSKDQECRSLHSKIANYSDEVETLTGKISTLEHQYQTLMLQYEEKQKSLLNTQNEILHIKQNNLQLVNQHKALAEKYNELVELWNNNASKNELKEKMNDLEVLNATLQNKHALIQEKDKLIQKLTSDVESYVSNHEHIQMKILELQRGHKELEDKVKEDQSTRIKLLEEKEILKQKLADKISEIHLFSEMNDNLKLALKESGDTVHNLEERISSLVKEKEISAINIIQENHLRNDSEVQSKIRSNNEIALLELKEQECKELKNEIEQLMYREDHLKKELDRLRKHMLQIEDHYTNEALRAEDREKQLRIQLAEFEKSAKLSSTAVIDASHHANVQIASLQEEVAMLTRQRDNALEQFSDLEDKVQLYSTSSNNLQLVLEKRQKEHEQKLREVERKWLGEINAIKLQYAAIQKIVDEKQQQLDESSQALQAASRLSEVLDMKEDVISNLKQQLLKLENSLKSAHQELDALKNNTDGKVDRVIMKSLVLGYFSAPPTQKSEVVRLLARVLDFNQEEMQKAGIVVSRNTNVPEHKGLFSSLLGRLPSIGGSPTSNTASSEPSFTALFVKFLENESQPIIRMPLPAEEMAREVTSKNYAKRRSSNSKASTSGTPSKSALLLSIDSAFPTFTTLPAVDYNDSSSILKEVLE